VSDLDLLAGLVKPRRNKYMPHTPFPKQMALKMLPHDEALMGGALGGGKSDVILDLALEYVTVPGYACLILRKTLTDLKQSGALLDRMMNWMMPFLRTKEVRYEASTHKFLYPTFSPSGERMVDACVQFGYIGESNAYTRYQGIEVQGVYFDEVTQHAERDYDYLFTRLRKCVCPLHTERDAGDDPIYYDNCQLCQWAKMVPIRMRSTCNPDGIGFAWVKRKFKISPDMTEEEAAEKGVKVRWIGKDPKRPFIPSTYKDNPYLDHKAYEARLKQKLSAELYEALVEGSWGVVANARYKKHWARYYSIRGELLYLGPNFSGRGLDMRTDIQEIFQTIDSATTSEEGPGDVDLFPTKVKNPSWSVISTWALTTCFNLLFLHMIRFREEIPEVVDELRNQYEMWQPSVAIVEENGVGKGVSQFAARMGMNIEGLHKDKDKLVNSTNSIIQMKSGRIWFPWGNPSWLGDAEEEIFTWQGHPQETDDIIDTLAHAANHVKWENAGSPDDYFMTSAVQYSDIPITVMPRNRYKQIGH